MQIKNVRFIVAAIAFFSAYAVYMSRVNLSIAIIAMVESPHHTAGLKAAEASLETSPAISELPQEHHASVVKVTDEISDPIHGNNAPISPFSSSLNRELETSNKQNTTIRVPLTTIFPTSEKSVKTPLISREKFDWDQTEQGHILGSFFYGYILFQIPGARMAEAVGAKWIIMASCLGSGLISLIFPLSTQLNSIYLLMLLRFVMGLCQSAFFPAAYVLFCKWLPERERSVLLPVMFIGSNMGSVSTYIFSSYLISSNYGWPSVFMVSGLVCLLVSLMFFVFGSNGPEDNWLITKEERRYIERNVNNQSSESNSLDGELRQANGDYRLQYDDSHSSIKVSSSDNDIDEQQKSRVPIANPASSPPLEPEPSWPKLLKSVPVWTFILSMYGNEWSNIVLCYELPTYLNSALNYPIERNGVINSFFQLSFVVASPIVSSLAAYMLDKRLFGMHKIHVRKLFQSLATFGQMICFASVPICGRNEGLIILLMFTSYVFKACANGGDIMVAGDLSPEFAGTIFAFANSVGNTAGFIVPLCAGFFVSGSDHKLDAWVPFWLTTALIMAISGLIFLIFGETRRQDFAKEQQPASSQMDQAAEKLAAPEKRTCCLVKTS